MRARGQMYFWQEKQPFNWNKVCIVLARLMSFISVNKRIFQGLALHTVTHIPSRRFPRTCNRRTLIEFFCRVTWPSVAIIRSSPWPVTSARDLSRPSGPSETGALISLVISGAIDRLWRGRQGGGTALITGISFVWKSLSSSHKNSRKQTHEALRQTYEYDQGAVHPSRIERLPAQ